MKIIINGDPLEVDASASIETVLEHLKQHRHVAVALNEQIVPKADWHLIRLKENDEIMIVTIAQGG